MNMPWEKKTHRFHLFHHKEFTPPEIKPLTDKQRDTLQKCWDYKGSYITSHDGTPREWMDTTLNIKENPLLVKAIEEIRDQYFDLLNHMMQLERNHGYPILERSKNKNLRKLEDEVSDQMVVQNRSSITRLMSKNYGFTPEQADEIFKSTQSPEVAREAAGQQLSEKEAYLILSKLIGRAIDTFEAISTHRGRVDVPKSFMTRREYEQQQKEQSTKER